MKKLFYFLNETFFRCVNHDYFFQYKILKKKKIKQLELATADAEEITEVTIDSNEGL